MPIRTAHDALAATWTTPEPSPDTPDGPQCLRWVWMCYGSIQSDLPPLASVAYAKQGWIYSPMQHPGDRHPPAGAPVYFSGSDGHIAIATGNGEEVRSTEWPWGHTGTTTISEIESAWGRTYYGWTGDMLGHPIEFDTTTAGSDGTATETATPTKKRRPSGRTYILGEEDEMSQPIIARGDKLDVWYALYNRVVDATADVKKAPDNTYVPSESSGPVYFGRRLIGPGERAAIVAFQKQTGYLMPDTNQKEIVQMPQATFDQINKIAGSDYSR